MSGNRVLALIDGFNYYHRLNEFQQKSPRCVKWLNYRSLIESWLSDEEKQHLEIIYFSAKAKHRGADVILRHNIYIQALESVNIRCILGEFKPKGIKKCRQCERCNGCNSQQDNKKLERWEEKNTDVNIGITLLEYTIYNKYDKCLLLSSDSDFIPAVKRAKEINPNNKIIICPPPIARNKPAKRIEYNIDGLEQASKCRAWLTNFYCIKKHQFQDNYMDIENPWKI